MSNFKILFIGGACLELVMNMYKIPEEGQTLIDDGGVAYVPGGCAAFAAVAASKMGADSALCAALGADSNGQTLYSYYKDCGIDASFLRVVKDSPTGFTASLKENDCVPRRINYPGANLRLSDADVLAAVSSNPDLVYITFEAPFSVVFTAARAASSRNIPIIIDASPAMRDYPLEELPPVDVFALNTEETLEYTGEMPMGATASLRAALALAKRVKSKYFIIKQGSRGSFLYDGKHYKMEASLRLDKPHDTSGVGDIFTAALALEYIRSNKDIATAIKYATAASAISVTRVGAASSVPVDSEVMAVYNESYT